MKTILLILITIASSLSFSLDGEWKKGREGRTDYWIYSSKSPSSKPRMLMLSLHGCVQTYDAIQKGGNWEKAADQYDAVVVLPQVPDKGVIVGCWDFFGKDHKPDTKHHKDLISLIETLLKDQAHNIDPQRVYLSGISSGGGETAIMGCLRPDLIAGIGLSSAPAIGTDQNTLKNPNVTPQESTQLCIKYADRNADYLKRLKVVLITADKDMVVSPKNTNINLEVFKALTGATEILEIDTKTLPGTKTDGKAYIYSNIQKENFVSLIINNGIGHNWPGGQGGPAPAPYVTSESVNFPLYLLKFFSENP